MSTRKIAPEVLKMATDDENIEGLDVFDLEYMLPECPFAVQMRFEDDCRFEVGKVIRNATIRWDQFWKLAARATSR